jgi:hypothetical protein
MAKSIMGLVALIGIGIGIYVFWNPTICQALDGIGGSLNFDFCSLKSTKPADTGGDTGLRPKIIGVDTTVTSPVHKHAVAVHHDKLVKHNNASIHAAHKALQEKHNLPGGHHLPHLSHATKCSIGICATQQCEGCPPIKATPAKASLGYASDFRMSI